MEEGESFDVFAPTYAVTGELIGVKKVLTFTVEPSPARPFGAALQELEFATGIAHLFEPKGEGKLHKHAAANRAAMRAAEKSADAEQAAAVRARIEELLSPGAAAREQARQRIEQEHELLVQFASDDEVEALVNIKNEAIAALEPTVE